jgi:tetratricopeptide (TPR) repeat protein
MAEQWLASPGPQKSKVLVSAMSAHPATALETASEYLGAGLWKDGAAVLELFIEETPDRSRISPLAHYYLAYFSEKMGQTDKASECGRLAAQLPADYVFPFQSELIEVLDRAMKKNPNDARAPYYLGNLLFDSQPDEAVKLWEQSVALDSSFAIAYRNLAIAYSHRPKGNILDKAIMHLEKAVSLPRKYPIHFTELDELYASAGMSPEKRLAVLDNNMSAVAVRDDALSRAISLKIFAGSFDDAIRLMTGRHFNVWEGGSLNVASDWTDAHLLRGRRQLDGGRPKEALADFQVAGAIPDNLPNDKVDGPARLAETAYWTGMAHEALGETELARQSWKRSADASGLSHSGGRSLSDRSVQRYYQALSLRKVGGGDEKVLTLFRDLVKTGEESLGKAPIDPSAAFSVQQSQRSRIALAHYVAGLGCLGLEDKVKAKEAFEKALEACPDHLGAKNGLAGLK